MTDRNLPMWELTIKGNKLEYTFEIVGFKDAAMMASYLAHLEKTQVLISNVRIQNPKFVSAKRL